MIRLVDAKRGRFLVFDNDKFLGRSLIELGEFIEPQAELFDLLLRPQSVVVEVGANIGAHTIPIARKAAKVYAFEPQRRVYNLLCGNLALNGIENVETYRAAGGEKPETVGIGVLDYDSEVYNFGSFSLLGDQSVRDSVKVVPIQIPCHFLKVDVEGYEAKVLRGSADMIREHQPIMYVENDRTELSDELISLVHDLGYKAYWHISDLYREDNHNKAPNPFGSAVSVDLVCIPKAIPFGALKEARVGEKWDLH